MSKIYTKTGDKGQTSLIGGTRVPKYHIRLESYGTVDELNSHIGLIRDLLIEDAVLRADLFRIQNLLFSVCTELANENDIKASVASVVNEEAVSFLERRMDAFSEQVAPLKNFILPGGHIIASHCHIARTVCRRAERSIIKLSEEAEVSEILIKFINRLSDFMFLLARKILKDFNKDEILWKTDL
jgi:cob(I)alamin adenosyltransferase